MRSGLRLAIQIGVLLTCLLTALVLLACGVLASRAGEIAYENDQDGNWEIYVIDIGTGISANLTRNPADDTAPGWSPDGQKISFISTRETGQMTAVYLMNADGSDVHRISAGDGIYRDPTWTGDGHTLALTHGFRQIYLVDANNAQEEWLAVGISPRLSPDRTQLLYYAEGTNYTNSHIYLLDMVTHQTRDLTPGDTHNWDGVWSPDGQRIAFVSARSGKARIYVMNRDGSGLHAVTAGENDVTPSWSPDGRQIVYASGGQGDMRLYVINADGSGKRVVSPGGSDHHAPSWRP